MAQIYYNSDMKKIRDEAQRVV